MFRQQIINLLFKEVKLKKQEITKLIEIPPDFEFGDYSFPCFILSKKQKKSPIEIAERLSKKIKTTPTINKIQAKAGYLNFFINKNKLAKEIIKINANFGKINLGKKKKILIDFSAPNIGKPMHIGHIRSTIIGDSMMRIYDFLGYDTIGINYLGDIGLHIGKLIVAYELWVNKQALKKDPVAELLRLYVKFCGKEKPNSREEIQENEYTKKAKQALKKLELGDKKTEKIFEDIKKYSGKGFNKVYDMLNIDFTETIGQSQFEKKGKEIVMNALEGGIAKREKDGAIYIELPRGKKYILRSNETASYITYDLGAAFERDKKYKFEKMIYVTDFRQEQHFQSLFLILKLMKYDFSNKLVHLPFGTVKFGKEIMATRKGDMILLEHVLEKTIEKAKEEIVKRKTKGNPEKVGVGAVKYIILKNEPARDVQFSWEQALSFEGNTGPYLQYSYARACSIIKKAKNFNKGKPKIVKLTDREIELVKSILRFPGIVQEAGKQMNPSLIATYSFMLAKIFNEFYHKDKVLGDKHEAFRLMLVNSFRTTLKNALHLLGIEVMEEM